MDSENDTIIAWFAEIQVHSSNLRSLDDQLVRRGIPRGDHTAFRFTTLEIPAFYQLYRLSHKWKGTRLTVAGNPVIPSTNVTKAFRCCCEAVDWPKSQNEFYARNNRPQKQLQVKHYCYGYARTVYNIIGCQKIKAARDNRLSTGEQITAIKDKEGFKEKREGWMNRKFIAIEGSHFRVDFDSLKNEITKEAEEGPILCPFFVADRIPHGLDLLKRLIETSSDFWTIEQDGTLNPRPIEYYFDMRLDERIGSKFIHQHSIVFFFLISELLGLSLYETVRLIAIENPSPGFRIGFSDFGKDKTYVRFESLKELVAPRNLLQSK
jgi:hypothetical protein